MKQTFEDLKLWLTHRSDVFWYEDVDGHQQFDLLSMLSEVDAFAEAFERQIQ